MLDLAEVEEIYKLYDLYKLNISILHHSAGELITYREAVVGEVKDVTDDIRAFDNGKFNRLFNSKGFILNSMKFAIHQFYGNILTKNCIPVCELSDSHGSNFILINFTFGRQNYLEVYEEAAETLHGQIIDILSGDINNITIIGHSSGAVLLLAFINRLDEAFLSSKNITCITTGLRRCPISLLDPFEAKIEKLAKYYDIINLVGDPKDTSCELDYYIDEAIIKTACLEVPNDTNRHLNINTYAIMDSIPLERFILVEVNKNDPSGTGSFRRLYSIEPNSIAYLGSIYEDAEKKYCFSWDREIPPGAHTLLSYHDKLNPNNFRPLPPGVLKVLQGGSTKKKRYPKKKRSRRRRTKRKTRRRNH